METTGILKLKNDTQKVSEKFSKREFVITTESNTPYPQHVSFQLANDKCAILDTLKEGEEVKVVFNLKGREWSGPDGVKYFNTLDAWKVERVGAGSGSAAAPKAATSTSTPAAPKAEATPAAPVFHSSSNDSDDLPF
jgi:hypothetical protein